MNDGTGSDVVSATEKIRHAGSCPHCASLDVVRKGRSLLCRDCGTISRDGQIVKFGLLDLHYTLDVQAADGKSLWSETLDTLFEAQCDIAAGLRIAPGSSFTKWLKSKENEQGVIDDRETLRTMGKIARKMLTNEPLIRDPYNADAVRRLDLALTHAVRFRLTFTKR